MPLRSQGISLGDLEQEGKIFAKFRGNTFHDGPGICGNIRIRKDVTEVSRSKNLGRINQGLPEHHQGGVVRRIGLCLIR